MEDLVEEIVGDLGDELEHDETALTTIDERTSVVEGQIRVEDVNEELDLDIPGEIMRRWPALCWTARPPARHRRQPDL